MEKGGGPELRQGSEGLAWSSFFRLSDCVVVICLEITGKAFTINKSTTPLATGGPAVHHSLTLL